MAIAFARMEVITRSSGGSATRTAAYIHRIEIKDSRSGERFDFRHSAQAGDQHGVLLPEGAPDWMRDAARLWDAAERAERRKDSQTAYHVVVALPKATDGLGPEDQRALVESFAREQWGVHGLAVSFAIHPPHEGEDNWHAHLLVSTRRVDGNGLAARKARDLNPAFTRSVDGGLHVDGERWGVLWAEHQNRYFEAQGLELRVDRNGVVHQEHLGPKRHRASPEAEVRQERADAEAETAIAWRDPGTVLTLMTRTRATFTIAELDRELGKALPVAEERERVRTAVLRHFDLIRLRDWGGGEALDRYTTRAVIAQEREVLNDINRIHDHRHQVDPAVTAAVAARRTLRPDQDRACRAAWEGFGVVVIEGRAGTGKSHAIGALAEGYRQCGYTVVGLGPTNLVGQALAAEAEITRGGTLHSELWHLERGRRHWDKRTVVVVDEAAMVDSPTMARLTRAAARSGVKLILVGDARQLSSVERGGLFAELRDRLQGPVIETVTRQREDWQRRAAEHLAAGRHDLALEAFDAHDCLRWSETQDEARAALVRQWESDRIARPERSRFVFAYTNEDVDLLNAALRAVRQRRGELGEDVSLPTDRGGRLFAVGDRVQITATDKAAGLTNGQVGTIEDIRGLRVCLRRDDGRRVEFDAGRFHGFRHGYAGTIYKGQGRTLDETYLYHSRHWRSAASYVALTRQRHQALIFAATETATDRTALARQMARADDRRAASAYQPDMEWLSARAQEETARKVIEATGLAAAGSRVPLADEPPFLKEDFEIPPLDEESQAALDEWEAAMMEGGNLWARNTDDEPIDPTIARQQKAERAEAERAAAELEALKTLLLDGRSLTQLADGRIGIEGLTAEQFDAVTRHWPALSAAARQRADEQGRQRRQAQERQRAAELAEQEQRREAERLAAEQAEMRALLLDGRPLTRLTDGRISIEGVSAEQFDAVKRHWPSLSAAAYQLAAEHQATVRDYLSWLETTGAEKEAAIEAGDRSAYSEVAFRRRDGAARFAATGLISLLRQTGAKAAETTAVLAALSDAEVSARVDRRMVRIASERVAATIPEISAPLIAAMGIATIPEPWRITLTDALAKPNRIESAMALSSLTNEVKDAENQASRHRQGRASLETAVHKARQALDAATTHLWNCCQRASRNPEADYVKLIALSRTITEEQARTLVFDPPSGLRGGWLIDRDERRNAEEAAAAALPTALNVRKCRAVAKAAEDKLSAYASSPAAMTGQDAENATTAMAQALGGGRHGASETLMQAVSALGARASLAEVFAAHIPDEIKRAILSARQRAAQMQVAPAPVPQSDLDWEYEDDGPEM